MKVSIDWLGLSTLLGLAMIGFLVYEDKPVEATIFPLVTALAGALVHRSGSGQGAAAALMTPETSPDLHEVQQAVKFLQQNVRALEARTSPRPPIQGVGSSPVPASPQRMQNVSPPPGTPQNS